MGLPITYHDYYHGFELANMSDESLEDAVEELNLLHNKCCQPLVEKLLITLIQTMTTILNRRSKLNNE